MKISLIRPSDPETLNDRVDLPIGLLYVGTPLKEAGHDVEILDFTGGYTPEIKDADLYGINLYTTSYPDALEIRDKIRSVSNSPIMVGGPHTLGKTDECVKDFDYVVIGEAEIDLPPMVGKMADRSLSNPVLRCKPPKLLGELSIPDYTLVDLDTYGRKIVSGRAVSIISGRGCPFRCTYCFTAALAEKVRLRPKEHLMEELHHLVDNYGVEMFRFVDDNFLMARRYFRSLVPHLKDLGKPYAVFARAQDLRPDLCSLLAESGCVQVNTGVEHGAQSMHDLMNTRKNVETMITGVTAAKANGIYTRISLIVGYPGETWDTVRESIRNLKRMPFDSYAIYNFIPLPGTPLYDSPEEYGITWLSPDYKDYYLIHGEGKTAFAFESDGVTRQLLKEWRDYMISELDEHCDSSISKEYKQWGMVGSAQMQWGKVSSTPMQAS